MPEKEKTDITAYSIYNLEQKKRTKINPLEDIYPKLPKKKISGNICRSSLGLWRKNAV